MLDEAMRHRLHGRLAEVLGADEAAALMSALPPTEHATKADLDLLEGRLRGEMGELRSAMREGFAGIRAEMADDRADSSENLRLAITAQTRQVFFGLIGVIVSFGGFAMAASRFGH